MQDPTTPTTPAETPPVHTTVIHGDQPVVSVQFGEGGEAGYWSKCLWYYVDSGALASLSGTAAKVMGVFLRHRSSDSTSWPSLPVLMRESGYGRSAVFEAVTELLKSPYELLARPDPKGPYVVFPGRSFATRRSPAASPGLRTQRIFGSADADEPSTTADPPSATADRLGREIQEDIVDTAAPRKSEERGGDGTDDDVAALVLRSEGNLTRGQVAGFFVAGHTRHEIEVALDNTLFTKSEGKIKKSFIRCMVSRLSTGGRLFTEVEKKREENRIAELGRRYEAIVLPRIRRDADHVNLFTAAWATNRHGAALKLSGTLLARQGVLTEAELVGEPDVAYALMVERAYAVLDARNPVPGAKP